MNGAWCGRENCAHICNINSCMCYNVKELMLHFIKIKFFTVQKMSQENEKASQRLEKYANVTDDKS